MQDTFTRVPRHVAIIMDGNGRWARRRHLPRTAGHKAGVNTVRRIIEQSAKAGIEQLTLFAFSSENWRRPQKEVGILMKLFISSLQDEMDRLNQNNIRLRFIGQRSAFPAQLQEKIAQAEQITTGNSGLNLFIAANYGGRWDLAQAAKRLAEEVQSGDLMPEQIDEFRLGEHLVLAGLPAPDLFIRTGGEHRISNFLLWDLAYTELFFTDILWPDFDEAAYAAALTDFGRRQRRFGRTSEQVEQTQGA